MDDLSKSIVEQKTDDISARKKDLRREMRDRGSGLDPDYISGASSSITELILSMEEYRKADIIFCFVGEGSEPMTDNLISKALEDGKRVCVPLCVSDHHMVAKAVTDLKEDLAPGRYGIMEPSDSLPEIQPEELDLAIIPCVTCDHLGNRLGHGKGYYDRFLRGSSYSKVMICLEKMTVEEGRVPMDSLDLPIEILVTEKGIYRNDQ